MNGAAERNGSGIRVVYIVSSGRSGSTLLDLLLGSGERVWTLGEAQVLPWEVRENRMPCGCGEPVLECPFWSRVLPDVPLDDERDDGQAIGIDRFREGHGRSAVLRWPHVVDLLRGRVDADRLLEAEAYGRLNAAYFEVVMDAVESLAGHRPLWLVDASKDPYRLLWLQASGLFDLHVVHLTKDPASFVYSTTRDLLPGGRWKTVRSSVWWLLENALIHALGRTAFSPERVMHLRYDELAGAPEDTRRRFEEWLHVEFPSWEGRTFRESENHAIAGNAMRWEDTPVRFDDAWRRRLPGLRKALVRTVTGPLARRLGYDGR